MVVVAFDSVVVVVSFARVVVVVLFVKVVDVVVVVKLATVVVVVEVWSEEHMVVHLPSVNVQQIPLFVQQS